VGLPLAWDETNFARLWERLRRRATAEGIPAAPIPCNSSFLGDLGAPSGQERAVGSSSAWARGPCLHP
jgi:hypothetical protein